MDSPIAQKFDKNQRIKESRPSTRGYPQLYSTPPVRPAPPTPDRTAQNTKSATTALTAARRAIGSQKCQTACKPGSVHASRRETAIPLGRALLRASRDQPGRRDGNVPVSAVARLTGRPYSVLLPMGFTLPPLSPGARCALTAPFHPCLRSRSRAGGLFSVALSLRSPSPAVSRHRIPVEPGLSSTRAQTPAAAVRPSGKRGVGAKKTPVKRASSSRVACGADQPRLRARAASRQAGPSRPAPAPPTPAHPRSRSWRRRCRGGRDAQSPTPAGCHCWRRGR